MRHTLTTVELRGHIVGRLWWPIGAWGWTDAPGPMELRRAPDHVIPTGAVCCADHLGDMLTASGNFQGAMIARGSMLAVRRETLRTDATGLIVGRTVRERIVPVESIPSLAPYLAPEDAPTDDDAFASDMGWDAEPCACGSDDCKDGAR